jgi:tRNA 2-selenouridine synthase
VLDLERLARHRGSLLGDLPGDPQPTQKMFESTLFGALSALDPVRPVFVESESRRIGRLQVPDGLLGPMRASPCVRLETERGLRVAMLAGDYAHLAVDHVRLDAQLAPLAKLHGKATITRWMEWARAGATTELAADLLDVHYDPSYTRAIRRNFPLLRHAEVLRVHDAGHATFRELARRLLDNGSPKSVAA